MQHLNRAAQRDHPARFCRPFHHTSVTKSCPETLLIYMDTPKIVWYLENVGVRYRISFVLEERYFWIAALTMNQTPDAGWKTEMIWTPKTATQFLLQDQSFSGSMRATCAVWGWQYRHTKVACSSPSSFTELEVFLHIIFNSCSCPFLFRPNLLSQIPFNIIDIRRGVKTRNKFFEEQSVS